MDYHRWKKNGAMIHVGNPVEAGQIVPAMIVAVWGDTPKAPRSNASSTAAMTIGDVNHVGAPITTANIKQPDVRTVLTIATRAHRQGMKPSLILFCLKSFSRQTADDHPERKLNDVDALLAAERDVTDYNSKRPSMARAQRLAKVGLSR